MPILDALVKHEVLVHFFESRSAEGEVVGPRIDGERRSAYAGEHSTPVHDDLARIQIGAAFILDVEYDGRHRDVDLFDTLDAVAPDFEWTSRRRT